VTQRQAVIALGSNLGDRRATLVSALTALDAHPQISVSSVSSAYESAALKPTGVDPTAPEYLNAVALVDTTMTAPELLSTLMSIERDHGRERHERWGDRTLDLDIIDFGGEVIDTDELELPHPRAIYRAFVMAPWAEVNPQAQLAGLSVLEIASRISDDIRPVGALR
jgi:2-amino-4-hydroxy-6-hydroxymethyldihydropteridine diphosphokinase